MHLRISYQLNIFHQRKRILNYHSYVNTLHDSVPDHIWNCSSRFQRLFRLSPFLHANIPKNTRHLFYNSKFLLLVTAQNFLFILNYLHITTINPKLHSVFRFFQIEIFLIARSALFSFLKFCLKGFTRICVFWLILISIFCRLFLDCCAASLHC